MQPQVLLHKLVVLAAVLTLVARSLPVKAQAAPMVVVLLMALRLAEMLLNLLEAIAMQS